MRQAYPGVRKLGENKLSLGRIVEDEGLWHGAVGVHYRLLLKMECQLPGNFEHCHDSYLKRSPAHLSTHTRGTDSAM